MKPVQSISSVSKQFFLVVLAAVILCGNSTWVSAVTFTTDTLIDAGNVAYEGQDIVIQGCTLTVNGEHSFASLQMTNGVLTHSANSDVRTNWFAITIAGNAVVDVNSRIDASGRGYGPAQGPGAGQTWFHASGGGHGGRGGRASNWATGGIYYDSITQPVELGSGGGTDRDAGRAGGAGGGVIRLQVNGTMTLNGSILANGNGGSGNEAGGGAGGSIWLTVGTLGGNGAISANGGSSSNPGVAGGGGGGRIALYYTTNNFTSGTLSTYGGPGYYAGAAGTIFIKAAAVSSGSLFIKANTASAREVTILDAQTPVANLEVSLYGQVEISAPLTLASVVVKDTGTSLFPTVGQPLNLIVQTDVNIRTNASITASGRGYAASDGPGAGTDWYYASGGGHGGLGGGANSLAVGGYAYGSLLAPADLGSGGGNDNDSGPAGGAGGGAIRLQITGTLTVNGFLTAEGNGGAGNEAGGGAGGSIWVNSGTIGGNGAISVNGGTSSNNGVAGGGSGGRIALYYDTTTYAGTKTAFGGPGWQRGGPGTIFTKRTADSYGLLLVDAGGSSSNICPLHADFWPQATQFQLQVNNSAVAAVKDAVTFRSLVLDTGASLIQEFAANPFDVTILDNANIKTGTTVSASGKGYASSTGPGEGGDLTWAGGGGHGGMGGASSVGALGGMAYGSIHEPNAPGSGGGLDVNSGSPGGTGGGVIRFQVNGGLTINGLLTADGNSGGGNEAGGGAGGSIWLTVGALMGNGTISANGGAGSNVGVSGGGGGGCIALYFEEIDGFDGTITAYGGNGWGGGGAGTIFKKNAAETYGTLVIAANRTNRAATPLDEQTPVVDLEISSAGYVVVTQPLTLASIKVSDPASILSPAAGQPLDLTVMGDVVVSTEGAITATGLGYPSSEGPGAGEDYYYAAGGGYGGAGGGSTNGAVGGGVYGQLTQPTDLGSGGGMDSDAYRAGGSGGGAIKLTAFGTLTVNGSLTADGANGGNESGGGSGGSLWLIVGTLNGNGVISASGGNSGNASVAGGGGGGRIAIYWRDEYADFAQLRVNGGTRDGHTGTLYLYHGFLVGDYDFNNVVDLNDLAYFLSFWLDPDCSQPEWCGGADLNRDGFVDLEDYSIFVQQWGKHL